jgi:hypothetical protein
MMGERKVDLVMRRRSAADGGPSAALSTRAGFGRYNEGIGAFFRPGVSLPCPFAEEGAERLLEISGVRFE